MSAFEVRTRPTRRDQLRPGDVFMSSHGYRLLVVEVQDTATNRVDGRHVGVVGHLHGDAANSTRTERYPASSLVDVEVAPTGDPQVDRGEAAILLHPDLGRVRQVGYPFRSRRPPGDEGVDYQTAASDVIADVLHACRVEGLDAEEILRRASDTYRGDLASSDPGEAPRCARCGTATAWPVASCASCAA